MDYDQIIPLIVSAVQVQNLRIEQLQSMTALMMATNPNFTTVPLPGQPETNRLLDASPNPFTSTTNLRYNLLPEVNQAQIKIYDMRGVYQLNLDLTLVAGTGQVLLRSSDLGLKGQYVFALFINGSLLDAKTVVYQ